MLKEFKAFLLKQNILALALAVVIGAATNELVQAVVSDFIMPIVTTVGPNPKNWEALVTPGPVAMRYGHFLGILLNFVIVAFVCWRITKAIIKEPTSDPKPATKECQYCRQQLDARATRCAYCTSALV
jgi:large conductance mechanosensitive channel